MDDFQILEGHVKDFILAIFIKLRPKVSQAFDSHQVGGAKQLRASWQKRMIGANMASFHENQIKSLPNDD